MLLTVSEVKAYLKIAAHITEEDAMLTHFIQAAQSETEMVRGCILEQPASPITETIVSQGEDILLKAYPVQSITSVKVDGVTTNDYTLRSTTGILSGSFPTGSTVEVTYTGGFTTTTLPAHLKQELLERVAYRYENRRGTR
jgi:uncharacterized phiE125 gp8 family phage protein